jgi:hypothetical protein
MGHENRALRAELTKFDNSREREGEIVVLREQQAGLGTQFAQTIAGLQQQFA